MGLRSRLKVGKEDLKSSLSVKLGCEWKKKHWAFIQGIEHVKQDPFNLPLPIVDICGLLW